MARHVDAVRAGRALRPAALAGRCPRRGRAVLRLGPRDHPAARRGDQPGKLGQGEYGSASARPRILRLLAGHDIPATFFMPAVSRAAPSRRGARAISDAGHEVAVHGWIHERNTAAQTRGRARTCVPGRRHAGEAHRRATGGHPHAVLGLQRDATLRHHPRAGLAVRLVADGRRRAVRDRRETASRPASSRSQSSGSATTRRTSPWTDTPRSGRYTPPARRADDLARRIRRRLRATAACSS